MNWNERYAAEKTAIALKNDPYRLHPEHQRALKMMGGLLNAEHLTFGYDPKAEYRGEVTDTNPENWQPIDRVSPSAQRPDYWEHAIRPRMEQLRLHPDSIEAFNKINKVIRRQDRYPQIRNPYSTNYDPNKTRTPFAYNAIAMLRGQIRDQVEGRKDTMRSDSSGGGYKELHFTIENAPRTQVELHRGLAIHSSVLDGLKEGSENLEHNREVLKKYYAPGSVHPIGIQSWTADPNVAQAFSRRVLGNEVNNGGISAILHLPKGSKALQISGLGGYPTSQSQHEYLGAFDHHVVKKHEVDKEGVHHIYLEQSGAASQDVRQRLLEKDRSYETGYEDEMRRGQEPMQRHWNNVDRETTIRPYTIQDTTKIVQTLRDNNPGKTKFTHDEIWDERKKSILF